MNFDLLHVLLAVLGLSFIVFIHELGHYLVARHVGMRVEVFSIGFGKPMYVWTHKGVKWQVCYLLFGGYVKISGMEKEGAIEPHQIKDGFYGKSPWDRIKVVIMGPLVNIVFAFIVFTAIWMMGGREKRFEEFTNIIGWVDPVSELVQKGVKPGDTITEYGGKKFAGSKDLFSGGAKNSNSIDIQGDKIDYFTGKKVPYEYNVQTYPMAGYPKGMKTAGIIPANYVLFYGFDPVQGKYSPAYNSGIEKGDRIIWANGEVIFSGIELRKIVNRNDVYLTVERKGAVLHLRVPRIALDDLQLNHQQRDEFLDWKHALGITTSKEEQFFIPYEVDVLGSVKGKFSYIDSDLVGESEQSDYKIAGLDEPLEKGDHILAVNGKDVTNGLEIFNELRMNKVLIAVDRKGGSQEISSEDENKAFATSVNWKDLQELTDNIGTINSVHTKGTLVLLNPMVPTTIAEFQSLDKGKKDDYEIHFASSLKKEKKALEFLFLGAMIGDKQVVYNPNPIDMCGEIISETWHNLSSLVTGNMSPKWFSGPVGIMKAMHYGMSVGLQEALYWMGLISLSLGLINLLPVPGLDGGHVCFSLWEGITKKPIPGKVMEKMILPFIIMVVAFFLYVTFYDISRFF